MKTHRLLAVIPCALAATAYAGPDWVEVGDAGSTFNTAQVVLGIGQLTSIEGSLSSGLTGSDFEDVYLIRIETPGAFRFDLTNTGFDSMLWLFNVTKAGELFGLLANNDSPSTMGALIPGPNATDSTGAMVTNPGVYAIAITGFNRRPSSRTGDIFSFASNTEISGPDGPGAINPLQTWVGEGATGDYVLTVQGVGFVDVPAPGTGALLAVGLLAGARRRR
jgi:hypothetical protein